MRTIANTPAAQRFLMVAWRLSANAWQRECESVINWLSTEPESVGRVERAEMVSIIQRPLAPTEHPVIAMHCYADVPAGTTWDVVFNPNEIADHESTTAVSRFGLIDHRIVSPSLSDGWHQVAVIDFPKGLPRLIQDLPVDPDTEWRNYICLCANHDFEEIKKGRPPVS